MIIVVDDHELTDAIDALESYGVDFSMYSSIADAYIHTELEDIISFGPKFKDVTDEYIYSLTNAVKDDSLLVEHLTDTLEKESLKWIEQEKEYYSLEENKL